VTRAEDNATSTTSKSPEDFGILISIGNTLLGVGYDDIELNDAAGAQILPAR
jgi:hypothetical protein